VKLFVSGFYGYDNLGDDAIFLSLALWAREHGHSLIVSAGPSKGPLNEIVALTGIACEFVGPTSRDWLKAIPRAQAVLFGGGGLFTTDDPTKLRRFLTASLQARLLGKRLVFIGVGVNPVWRPVSKFMWRIIARLARRIVVRSQKAYDIVEGCIGQGMAAKTLKLASDLVFAIDFPAILPPRPAARPQGRAWAFAISAPWADREFVLPGVPEKFERYFATIVQASRRVLDRGGAITLVPFFLPDDIIVCEKLAAVLQSDRVDICTSPSLIDRVAAMDACDLVLSCRFHGLVIGSSLKKPVVTIAYDYKHTSLSEALGLADLTCQIGLRASEFFGTESDIDTDLLLSLIDKADDRRDVYAAIVDGSARVQAALAKEALAALDQALT
jgi:polysaccharide pyruvyl transferase WcaK-like protein